MKTLREILREAMSSDEAHAIFQRHGVDSKTHPDLSLARRSLAKKLHSDRGGDDAHMKDLNVAYDTLKNKPRPTETPKNEPSLHEVHGLLRSHRFSTADRMQWYRPGSGSTTKYGITAYNPGNNIDVTKYGWHHHQGNEGRGKMGNHSELERYLRTLK